MSISRTWTEGDVVTVPLPMPAPLTWPDPRIDAVRGQVAVERGPLVDFLESADFGADTEEAIVEVENGLQIVSGDVLAPITRRGIGEQSSAYSATQTAGAHTGESRPVCAVASARYDF